jgi:hypothetical protein
LAQLLPLACLIVSCLPAQARAERAALLFVGPELRTRAQERAVRAPLYELALPHGIVSLSRQTSFVARLGAVLPPKGAALAFPASMGLYHAPFESVIRPLWGADFGGYLVQARGAAPEDSPAGPEWCWTVRALAGALVRVGGPLSVLLFLDGMWAQTPQDPRSREVVFSSLGAGLSLHVAFSLPRIRLADMLLHGTDAPEGF